MSILSDIKKSKKWQLEVGLSNPYLPSRTKTMLRKEYKRRYGKKLIELP